MKLIYLVIFLFLNSIIGFSQNVPNLNQTDSKGRRQGEWQFYDKKDKVLVMSLYKNDLLHGSTIFYKNDQVLFRLKYKNHKLNGLNQAYKKGKIVIQVELKDNQLHGVVQRYDVKKNALRCVQLYQNNLREGRADYYLNKKLNASATYQNDLLHGEYTTYHTNGKVASKITFEKGLITGNQKEFDTKGNLIAEKILSKQKNTFIKEITYKDGEEISTKKIKEEVICVFGKTDINKLFFKNHFYNILPH